MKILFKIKFSHIKLINFLLKFPQLFCEDKNETGTEVERFVTATSLKTKDLLY
jgi:hypothetical protein